MTTIEFEPKASEEVRYNARLGVRYSAFDIASLVLLIALIAIALFTFRDYAISNDEEVQHHYGELQLSKLEDLGCFSAGHDHRGRRY
ncbi:MAG TPA: hypothetical protein VIK28_00450 [Sedimentisphaerales bacterium]